jgi:hypothetical protein
MSRVANDGTKTMGELIDQVLHDMMKIYTFDRTGKKATVEKFEAINFALMLFARELSDTYTSRDWAGVRVGDMKIGGE